MADQLVLPTLPVQASQGMARLGLDAALQALWASGTHLLASEQAHRRADRLSVAGSDEGRVRHATETEARENAEAVRQLQRAVESMPRNIDDRLARQLDAEIRTPDFAERLRYVGTVFSGDVIEMPISGEEAEFLIGMWANAEQALLQEGFGALIAPARENVEAAAAHEWPPITAAGPEMTQDQVAVGRRRWWRRWRRRRRWGHRPPQASRLEGRNDRRDAVHCSRRGHRVLLVQRVRLDHRFPCSTWHRRRLPHHADRERMPAGRPLLGRGQARIGNLQVRSEGVAPARRPLEVVAAANSRRRLPTKV
jgi:hypothetical protein